MEVWVPQNEKIELVQLRLQEWVETTRKYLYRNILQDRINSLYPRFNQPRTLYILTVSADRILSFTISPNTPPVPIVPVKQCAICHEEDTVVRRTLRCNHTFHVHCIDKWLTVNNTCPLCRQKIYF